MDVGQKVTATWFILCCLVQAKLSCLVVSVLVLSLTWPSKTWVELLGFFHAHLISYLSDCACVFVYAVQSALFQTL